MINRVVLVGRLTRDPELRYTPNGVAVANFTIAVNRPFSNQQGEREADFISIVVWRAQAENVANYVKKGHSVGLDGRLQTRSFDNSEGKRQFVTEVVADSVQFLEPKGSGQSGNTQQNQQRGPQQNQQRSPQQGQVQGQQQGQRQGQGQGQRQTTFNDNPFNNDPFGGPPIDINDDDLPF